MTIISIVVPVYNSESFLHECLDSIITQTFENFELLLIDDGSTDNSGEICDEYAKKDSRIKVYHQENSGQAVARNRGIKYSSAEWICFIDSDDVVNPCYLEYLYKAITENNVLMSVCGSVEKLTTNNDFFNIIQYDSSVYSIDEENMLLLSEKISSTYWTIWAKLIKKDIVLSYLFCEGKIYEDNAIAPKWLYEAKKIAVVDLPLYFYRKNEQGTTKSEFSLKNLDLLWALEEQLEFLDSIAYSKMRLKILLFYIDCSNSMICNLKNKNFKNKALYVKKQGKKTVRKYGRFENITKKDKKKIDSYLYPFIYRLKHKLFG